MHFVLQLEILMNRNTAFPGGIPFTIFDTIELIQKLLKTTVSNTLIILILLVYMRLN